MLDYLWVAYDTPVNNNDHSDVDLVLCGHKHRPWLWDFNNLLIANAGSTSSERVRGFFENSYNIVKIEN